MRLAKHSSLWILLVATTLLAVLWAVLGDHGARLPSRADRSAAPPEHHADSLDTREIVTVDAGALRQVACIDLLNCERIPGLCIAYPRADQLLTATTDEHGVAQFDSEALLRVCDLKAVPDTWRMVIAEPGQPSLLYMYRELIVEGLVRAVDPDPPTLSSVALTYRVTGLHPLNGERAGGQVWLRRHNVPTQGTLGSPTDGGTFAGRVPRMTGLTFQAAAPGWYGDCATVRPNPADEVVQVVIELRRGTRIAGTLRDENGVPLAGVPVALYISVHGTPDNLTYDDAVRLGRGSGFAYRCSVGQGIAAATFCYDACTDEDGHYDVFVKQEGDLTVRAYVPGRAPVTHRAPLLRDSDVDLALVARTQPSDVVSIQLDGSPAKSTRIEIVQVTQGHPQITVTSLVTDTEGRVSTPWLERGQAYVFSAGDDYQEFVEWSGQAVVNIVPLSKKSYQLLPPGWW